MNAAIAAHRVARVETWIVTLPREQPYLGKPGPGDVLTSNGYLVRGGNRTLYPTVDRSVLVRVSSAAGTVGWGETYGIVAPEAVTAIIADVLGPLLLGRDPLDPAALNAEFYDLQRVRGFWGGFWGDALVAIDIALWDLAGQLSGQPVVDLLTAASEIRVPRAPAAALGAYVSGLPAPTLAGRVEMARSFAARGFEAFKFAAAVSFDGIVEEMRALRAGLGPGPRIAVDLHWKFTVDEAATLIEQLAPWQPWFVEAPCAPEDADAQGELAARVAAGCGVPIALGEEWHNLHVALPRLRRRALQIIQPEVAHTGLSQFMAIGQAARARGLAIIPHATIGTGVFMAASLHGAAALGASMHEYQHSVFDRNLGLLDTTMGCAAGSYVLPKGCGLGVAPNAALWPHARKTGDIG